MNKVEQLRQRLAELVDELAETVEDEAAFAAKQAEIEKLEAALKRAEKAEEAQKAMARPVHAGMAVRAVEKPQFETLGDFLTSVIKYYSPERTLDSRLIRAPLGANESEATAGGFLVQTDFATQIWKRSFDSSPLIGRTTSIPISTNANAMKIPALVDENRATGSRAGGVRMYWAAEAGTVDPSKIAFRQIELNLKKLMGVWYITDEMMADAAVIASIANQAFSDELTFVLADAILRGDGVGKPQGLLNSTAKVAVSKEVGQAAGTIVKENIDKMYSRMWPRSLTNAAWYYNPDIMPQLTSMQQVVGTGGVPVFLPPGGLSSAPFGTLYGRPMFPIEHAETLGTEGDLMFLDMSQYLLASKGGAQTASSMHVRFLYDEQVFKITFRVDGQSAWNAPVTPYKGTGNTLSPFITLASRA